MSDFESDFESDFGWPSADRLEAIARSDRFLDALARGEQAADQDDSGDDELTALLEEWRDESRWPPAAGLVSEAEAGAALRDGMAAARRRTRRGLAVVGSVAATVLSFGGFSGAVAGSQPGDPLYGLHMFLLSEPPTVHDDRIALDAKTELDKVQQMIDQEQWDQAQDKLTSVSSSVQTVNDDDRKQDLIDQVNRLNAKVANRDPNATPSPGPQEGAAAPDPATPPVSVSVPTTATPSQRLPVTAGNPAPDDSPPASGETAHGNAPNAPTESGAPGATTKSPG